MLVSAIHNIVYTLLPRLLVSLDTEWLVQVHEYVFPLESGVVSHLIVTVS